MRQIVPALTLEWWRASGERTFARLESLFAHFADAYNLRGKDREDAWFLTRSGAGRIDD